jgi:hypothetical protein
VKAVMPVDYVFIQLRLFGCIGVDNTDNCFITLKLAEAFPSANNNNNNKTLL